MPSEFFASNRLEVTRTQNSLALVHNNYTVISHKRRRPKKINLNVLIFDIFLLNFSLNVFSSLFFCVLSVFVCGVPHTCLCCFANYIFWLSVHFHFHFHFSLLWLYTHTLYTKRFYQCVKTRMTWEMIFNWIEREKNLTIENAFTMQFED